MSRRVVGLVVAGVGAVVVFIAAAADLIGIGSADYFGNRQIIATVPGALVVAAGLVVAFLPPRPAGRRAKTAHRPAHGRDAGGRPTPPVKHRRKR